MFSYLKKLDNDCNFEVFNEYMDKLVNEKFIDVQDHGEQESLFIMKEITHFINISLVSLDLVDKFIHAEVIQKDNETAKDSSRNPSDPDPGIITV